VVVARPGGQVRDLDGRSANRRLAGLIGKATTASVLATYSVSPARAIPNGEWSPARNTVRVSATPSPFASRSSVMRLALGTAPPAFFWYFLKK
jgi:hypothetical protein